MHSSFSLLALLPSLISAAVNPLVHIPSGFGPNPTNVSFNLYLPPNLKPNAPILVNPHWCWGTAQNTFEWTQFANLADAHGYIVIYPDSPNLPDHCWDVSSAATLTHDGGGDSLGIVSMVRWTLKTYGADPSRVFAMGTSSGAMMTNVLLGAYPDVFAAGSAWAGVAFGCFAGPSGDYWNSDCANGLIVKTGAAWKSIVQAAFPSYKGWRPKMQVWHGSNDTILFPQNFKEEIKEWTSVLGLSEKPTCVEENKWAAGWTTSSYGKEGRFEATLAKDVTHNIPTNESAVIEWFDLACKGKKCFSRPKESRVKRWFY